MHSIKKKKKKKTKRLNKRDLKYQYLYLHISRLNSKRFRCTFYRTEYAVSLYVILCVYVCMYLEMRQTIYNILNVGPSTISKPTTGTQLESPGQSRRAEDRRVKIFEENSYQRLGPGSIVVQFPCALHVPAFVKSPLWLPFIYPNLKYSLSPSLCL